MREGLELSWAGSAVLFSIPIMIIPCGYFWLSTFFVIKDKTDWQADRQTEKDKWLWILGRKYQGAWWDCSIVVNAGRGEEGRKEG